MYYLFGMISILSGLASLYFYIQTENIWFLLLVVLEVFASNICRIEIKREQNEYIQKDKTNNVVHIDVKI